MMNYANDNERSFQSIGLAALLIINKLRLATQLSAHREKHHDEHDDRTGRAKDAESSGSHDELVLQRLRDLERFERQARGK